MSPREPVEVRLPELGLPQQTLTVGAWHRGAGRVIIAGDALVEILAANATVDIPAPASGVVVRTLVATGQPVRPGQPLALIRPEEDA